MSKFGFKYMQVEEPNLKVDDADAEELLENYEENRCIFCNKTTDLAMEFSLKVTMNVPVCKKHSGKFNAKEKVIMKFLESIECLLVS